MPSSWSASIGVSTGLMTGTRPANPKGLDGMSDYPNLADAMSKRGWDDALIAKVMGGNWLAFLDDAWTPED